MIEHIFGNYIIEMAVQSGYEVRIVDAWSAYKWISKETTTKITKTMQNMQV